MDSQLKDLIEKIRKEGVAQAQVEADEILSQARKDAEALRHAAEAKAAALVETATAEVARREAASRDALKQASRDLLLALEAKLLALFRAAAREGVEAALVPALTETLLLQVVQAWVARGEAGVNVTLGGDDARSLGQALRASLGKTLASGVEILPSDRFSRGFRVSGSGSSLTLDLSAPALAELLAESLQPELARILRDSVR